MGRNSVPRLDWDGGIYAVSQVPYMAHEKDKSDG